VRLIINRWFDSDPIVDKTIDRINNRSLDNKQHNKPNKLKIMLGQTLIYEFDIMLRRKF